MNNIINNTINIKEQRETIIQRNQDEQYVACEHCALDTICRPIPIGEESLSQILTIMGRREPLLPGETLYRNLEPLSSIYAVTSGVIKLLQVTSTGREQVVGFRFPGELLGDEAMFQKRHIFTAEAIDKASVCRIPIGGLNDLGDMIPAFQKNLIDLLSRQCFVVHQQFASYAARNSAEERLAAFILNVVERTSTESTPRTSVQLEMGRDDIANFLGLRRETLSRTLTKLQHAEIIKAKGKALEILNFQGLRSLAYG